MSFWKVGAGSGSADTVMKASNKRVRLTKSGTQSITTGADRTIDWDTETIDTDSMHEGVTNPSRITFTTAGDYTIGANIFIDGNVVFTAKILMNVGATELAYIRTANGNPQGNAVTTTYRFAANDYIYLVVNPGSNTTVNATSSFFATRISK